MRELPDGMWWARAPLQQKTAEALMLPGIYVMNKV